MRLYLLTTGTLFVILVVMHLARALAEGARAGTDPMVLVSTVIAAGLAFWAFRLLRAMPRPK
jgi:hypothetical protein